MPDFEIFEVGGCVRDEILGLPIKDVDYTVVGPKSFEEFEAKLESMGFKIFVRTPEHFTIRAHFPKGWEFAGRDVSRLTGDFVLARKEGAYSDGRRPDKVEVGTLYDDLARRDFTVNAIAKNEFGEYIDPFDGVTDLTGWKMLRAVGSAEDRIREDALRALRALRFSLTKGFNIDTDIHDVLDSTWLPELVEVISFERRMDELDKMLKFDTIATLSILETLPEELKAAILTGYRLTPTSKKAKR